MKTSLKFPFSTPPILALKSIDAAMQVALITNTFTKRVNLAFAAVAA
ncbi:hypothetical protein VCRA2118O41_150019 [Vibrio crassostreae]|nr:hypothetical protein VCRA2118O41_150019 [Vibrio crassostreae]CAK1898817.1 hypothetical protein VCRA2110O180_200020 [Vibrio crassostreae]CAK1911387.1 hypothetical protein VCRA2113O198_210020 [Vibrio crassostreae]CAK1924399.1 hypothetical protein VCRA2113O228_230020 [Vibrio crassostreae]CAK2455688.1 hypothetical protein VCRA2113O225_220020 [Vibrio crassostreae]